MKMINKLIKDLKIDKDYPKLSDEEKDKYFDKKLKELKKGEK